MNAASFVVTTNAKVVALDSVPLLSLDDFQRVVLERVADGCRVSSMFGTSPTEIYAVLADDVHTRLLIMKTTIKRGEYPSLAERCPQVQLFEREIAEQFGLKPIGHPWFKPVRYVRSSTGRDAWNRPAGEPILPGVGDFYRVEGEQVHEVAVGPVHAGVIEPGHFRFQCHGETVFHLEIALGYQHRGVERALVGGPDKRSLHYAETIAGDTTIAHTTSYCHTIEALSACKKNARSHALRGIALELERLANHVGDLGAISGDVGYLATASYCGRIRGDFLNMTALLCGNRFGRGFVVPGGVGFDMDDARKDDLLRRLDTAEKETNNAVNLLWNDQSVMARLEDTGKLPRETAIELGIVGPAARASGLTRDIRCDQPTGIFRFAQIPVSSYDSEDVFARAYIRKLEIARSITFIREQLTVLPGGAIRADIEALAPGSIVVSLNEGWRGEVCHTAITDADGRFSRYKVVDPSFHNWPALAYALRDQEISDFPLCNKSFNLSYCGHDL
ncbi:MAG: NADH-quinone oxidoreductase subunit C [Treponemataceae bacterium]